MTAGVTDSAVAAFEAMATEVIVDVSGPDADRIAGRCQQLIERLAAELTRFPAPEGRPEASGVVRLNRAAGAWVEVPDDLDTVLRAALAAFRATDGAFDPTAGTGCLAKHPLTPGLWRLTPGARLDLGGIAKGHIADRARDLAVELGAAGVMVSLGTSSLAVAGERPAGGPWRVGLRDPGGPRNRALAVIGLAQGSLSTSGTYERGRPAGGARAEQATVVAAGGVTAEAWSTALLVLGPAGMTAHWTKTCGWEAMVVTESAVTTTPGFPPLAPPAEA